MIETTTNCTTIDGFTLPYTIIEAKNPSAKGVILYFHGGGLIFGQSNDLPQDYIDILTENYHLVLVSYRLAPESNIDVIINDALTQYDTIQQLYPTFPIFTFGRSAGAFLAMLTAHHRNVDGVIDFYGYCRIHVPAFLRPNKQYQALSSQITPDILNQLIQSKPLISGPIQTRYPIYLYVRGQAQWMAYLGIQSSTQSDYNISPKQLKAFPPTFIVHCTGDPDVPYSESEHIHRYINHSHFKSLSLESHDFDRDVNETAQSIYRQAVQFLDQIVQSNGGEA